MVLDILPCDLHSKPLLPSWDDPSTSIETLTVHLDCRFLRHHEFGMEESPEYDYLKDLSSLSVKLQTLSVLLRGTLKKRATHSFDNVLPWIPEPTTTSLSIPSSGVSSSASANSEYQEIEPMKSLSQYPNLHRLTAPCAALVGSSDLAICELPASVEVVEVVGCAEDLINHLCVILSDRQAPPILTAAVSLSDQVAQQEAIEFHKHLSWWGEEKQIAWVGW
jgi:hypothetical protein